MKIGRCDSAVCGARRWSVVMAMVAVMMIASSAWSASKMGPPAKSKQIRTTGWTETGMLTASDSMEDGRFGWWVAQSEDVLAVSADGAIYMFRWDGSAWIEEAKFGPYAEGSVGGFVTVHGDWVFAHTWNYPAGTTRYIRAYHWDGTSWSESAPIEHPEGYKWGSFGRSIAAGDGVLVVGDSSASVDDVIDAGIAYTFMWDGAAWVYESALYPVYAHEGDRYGAPVDIQDDVLAVAATGEFGGYVAMYRRIGGAWVYEDFLQECPCYYEDRFGSSIDIDGDVVLIGARGQCGGWGGAWIYRFNGADWVNEARLTPPADAGGLYEGFGNRVAVRGDVALVGSSSASDDDCNTVNVYHWTGAVWALETALCPTGAGGDFSFGWSFAFDGEQAIIGDTYNDAMGDDAGAVYMFIPPAMYDCNSNGVDDYKELQTGANVDCQFNGVPDECDIASGTSEDADDNGVPDECELFGLYVGPEGGSWFEPDHWFAGVMPDDTFDVTIPKDVVIDQVGAAAASVTILSGGALNLGAFGLDADHIEIMIDGALVGGGHITRDITGDVVNHGAVRPGDGVGRMIIDGQFFQSATGTLEIEVGGFSPGAEHDQLMVNGTATFNGRVTAVSTTLFEFALDDEFEVATFSALGACDIAAAGELDWCLAASALAIDDRIVYRITPSQSAPGEPALSASLTHTGESESDFYGAEIAIDGDVAVVGAHRDDDNGEDSGAVFIYRRTGGGWIEETKLTAPEEDEFLYYGKKVAINGDVIVVSAERDSTYLAVNGAAYVYRWNGAEWGLEAKLLASDPSHFAYFGKDVDIAGDMIVVGSPNRDLPEDRAGAVYVFNWDGAAWNEEAILLASDGGEEHEYGTSVSTDGVTIAAGAPGHGSVYLHQWSGSAWTEIAQLTTTALESAGSFGRTLEVEGDVVIVGATGGGYASAYDVGSAYAYRRIGTDWVLETPILYYDAPSGFENYGVSIALDGNVMLVGAPGHKANGSTFGLTYVYSYEGAGWTQRSVITPPEMEFITFFGSGVALDDGAVLIGARYISSVYAYTLAMPDDCNDNGVSDSCDIFFGYSEDKDNDGVPDECVSPPPCPWDTAPIGGDGMVGLSDLTTMLSHWGGCPAPCAWDFAPEGGGDDIVGLGDLNVLLSHWGPCP